MAKTELLNFEVMEYAPSKLSSVKRYYALTRKFGEKHVGLHFEDVKKVWENADDLAAHRATIEAVHPTMEIYIVSINADRVVTEISWPKRASEAPHAIQTPGAGTW